MGPPIPDDPDMPPGARNLVRILAETLQAHDTALASGDDLSARLTPQQWTGPASESFVDTGLPKIDTEWQQVTDVNQGITARVSGHSTFLYNLLKLWSGSDPTERDRLRLLWETATEKLVNELQTGAAELDMLGHVDFSDPETSNTPNNLAEPVLHETDAVPASPEREHIAVHPPAPAPQPGWPAEAMFSQSYRAAARLREQMLAGERRDHIPWTG